MSSRASAFQYAKGLFGVAEELPDVRAIASELRGISDLLAARDDLRGALASPVVPFDRKDAVLRAVLDLTAVAPLVRGFVLLLARHNHLAQLPAIVEEFDARVLAYLQIERADVTTAVPIPDAVQVDIARSLSAATGKQVQVSTRVDPSILGGVVARVGSLVFDGSVRGHLHRVRERLSGEP